MTIARWPGRNATPRPRVTHIADISCSTASVAQPDVARWPSRSQRSGFAPLVRRGQPRCAGSSGRKPMASSTASGNLAGCAVASVTYGTTVALPRTTSVPPPCPSPYADRGHSPRRHSTRRISLSVDTSSNAAARNEPAMKRSRWSRFDVESPGRTKPRQLLGGHPAVAAVHLKQQSLEVRRHLNVHRRTQRRDHDRDAVMSWSLTNRVRMSLVFDEMMKSRIGAPISRAIHPASTLPKLPVGTLNVGRWRMFPRR